MKISELLELIPFYTAKTLEPSEKKQVDDELSKSDELRDEVKFWTYAKHALKSESADLKVEHLSSEDIVDYAEKRLGANPEKLQNVENHLSKCDSCKSELKMISETYTEADRHVEFKIKPAPKGLFDFIVDLFKVPKLVYIVPTVLVLVVGTYITVQQFSGPTGMEMSFVLAYIEPTRDIETKDLPNMVIDKDVSIISLTILTSHSNIDSFYYSVNLITPLEKITEIQKNVQPVISGGEFDSVKVKIDKKEFNEGNGIYQLKVTEFLLAPTEDFKPKDFRYKFLVTITE